MQFSERWLRTLVDPPISTDELSHLLTMSGLEVEACEPVAPEFSGIVVAKVLEKDKHPNADRLSLCKVDAGTGEILSIVCGAPNVAAGQKVPCALVGAKLQGEDNKPFEIKAAKMRGVESHGMLCSARELGLSDDHSGLLVLPEDAPIGKDIRDFLALDDHKITIKLTPNRADALSVLGVAREVAALTGAPLEPPDVQAVPAKGATEFPFGISAPEGCGRFTGRVIRNVNAAASTPDWMKERLERAGQRPISALVDVTNYVMLELGRPLHVYDQDKLSGRIDVRFGRAGEKLTLLNEQTVEVDGEVLCITDESGPIGLAGIMGGDSTKADLDTRNIFLESAFFFPEAIAGRARRFNFASDASHRFERGVDFQNNVDGIERATRLILDICGGEPGPVGDLVARLPERTPVRMRVARAQKLIGVPISAGDMAGIFTRLGLPHVREGEGSSAAFVVTPPSFRFDIAIEEDLVEEVARVYGFERIPANPPLAPAVMHARLERRRSLHDLRDRLAAQGYREAVNFSFVEEDWEKDFTALAETAANPIRLLNPIAAQYSVMRSTLFGSLVANVRYNLNRKLDRVRVFEVGRVYLRAPGRPADDYSVAGLDQPIRVGGVAYGPDAEEQWGLPGRSVDFFDVKGDVEALLAPLAARFEGASHPALHPGRSARLLLDGRVVGWLGELHPRLQQKYELPHPALLFEVDAAPLLEVGMPAYESVSKYPAIVRDMAVVVPEAVRAEALLEGLRAAADASVREIRLFDVYRGKGLEQNEKSLAFRVVMQDTAKTLTDSEADAAMARLVVAADRNFGGKLRS
jgi:phenylalanyl-tRNA synthetase beta chain